MLNVTSRKEAAEKYPDSLGEYQLLEDFTHNGHPVYESLAKEDKYIIFIGNNINIIITALYDKYLRQFQKVAFSPIALRRDRLASHRETSYLPQPIVGWSTRDITYHIISP